MISYVAQVLNLFARTVLFTVHISSLIGKFIIITITWISSSIFKVLDGIASFIHIVYEDNISIFTEEVPNSVNIMVETVHDQINGIWSALSSLCHDVYKHLSAIVMTISQLADTSITIVCEIFSMLLSFLLFLGDTIWLIITFIPVHVPLLLKSLVKNISDAILQVIIDSYMALLKLTNFLTEVPLESFIGLTFAIIIIRLCIHFRENIHMQIIMLYWSLIRNFLYLYHGFYNYITNSEMRVISRVASGEELRTRDANFESENIDNADVNQADTLCVICQERLKCVLTLPCRHICLCTECCRRLYGYQRTCPICRTFIYHSVTVYL